MPAAGRAEGKADRGAEKGGLRQSQARAATVDRREGRPKETTAP